MLRREEDEAKLLEWKAPWVLLTLSHVRIWFEYGLMTCSTSWLHNWELKTASHLELLRVFKAHLVESQKCGLESSKLNVPWQRSSFVPLLQWYWNLWFPVSGRVRRDEANWRRCHWESLTTRWACSKAFHFTLSSRNEDEHSFNFQINHINIS